MRKQMLLGTDLNLSNICYGTGNFGTRLTREEGFAVLDAYADVGGNFIDTANVYCKWVEGLGNSSEQYIGAWLKARNAYNKMVIATKGGHYSFDQPQIPRINKAELQKDLEESLRTLGLDHIDFYWLHRDDERQEIGAIMEIMEGFVKEGKIRYYGASNYTRERMEAARIYADKTGINGFTAVSNQWSMAEVNPGCNINSDPSLVMMDKAYYQWHEQHQVPIIPFSASAYGIFQKRLLGQQLSAEMKKAYTNHKNDVIYQGLCLMSEETGLSVYALSVAWLLNQPFQVFPVASVSKVSQLKDFFEASEVVLDREFVERYIP